MLVYDDMENFEKIKVYNSGVEFSSPETIHQALVQYRIGDMFSPKMNQVEALALGAKEFINAINENRFFSSTHIVTDWYIRFRGCQVERCGIYKGSEGNSAERSRTCSGIERIR